VDACRTQTPIHSQLQDKNLLTALTLLLIKKGVFTREEIKEIVAAI
jgi:hypothetical protein